MANCYHKSVLTFSHTSFTNVTFVCSHFSCVSHLVNSTSTTKSSHQLMTSASEVMHSNTNCRDNPLQSKDNLQKRKRQTDWRRKRDNLSTCLHYTASLWRKFLLNRSSISSRVLVVPIPAIFTGAAEQDGEADSCS